MFFKIINTYPCNQFKHFKNIVLLYYIEYCVIFYHIIRQISIDDIELSDDVIAKEFYGDGNEFEEYEEDSSNDFSSSKGFIMFNSYSFGNY